MPELKRRYVCGCCGFAVTITVQVDENGKDIALGDWLSDMLPEDIRCPFCAAPDLVQNGDNYAERDAAEEERDGE